MLMGPNPASLRQRPQLSQEILCRRDRQARVNEFRLFQKITNELPIDTKLDPNYRVMGVRASRGELGLFYSIPSKTCERPSQKSIVQSEWEKAYQCLLDKGEFTLPWFKQHMVITARQSTSCSFRVVGEVFTFFGLAWRVPSGRGHKYVRLDR
jgi:hypothetical protein